MTTGTGSAEASRSVHIHLVSDSTGETIYRVARACVVQFEGIEAVNHVWSLVRSHAHLEKVLAGIAAHPGPVMFTLVDETLRAALQDGCRRAQVPLIPVLDPVIGALASYLGMQSGGQPGKQHSLDAEYFNRIDAMSFTLAHDDGQATWSLDEADIVLVGVSRTSKTPTCMYLANRGIKAANVPIVPQIALPEELFAATRPLIVGLTNDPNRLVQIRLNRLRSLQEGDETDYTDIERVREEVTHARRVFTERGWPVIEVTRRSIEETAAAILQLYEQRREARG
jgi:regulator of PEP synthase PpsR (kinase-PPPase family)